MSYILIAEDDRLTRQMLKQSLELVGHVAVAVENGRLALEKAQTLKPRLLMIDLMMPGSNGAEIIHIIRSRPEFDAMRIILITGVTNLSHLPDTADADLILQKPVRINELLSAIHDLVGTPQINSDHHH